MQYSFLLLSGLLLVPGLIILLLRRDLRGVAAAMAVCSLPFALTESFFYPTYWEPDFLFDLVSVIGFGIEDIIFVVGLAILTSTVYAFSFRKQYVAISSPDLRRVLLRAGAILAVVFLLVPVVSLAGIHMIYGSFLIMMGVSCVLFLIRNDLAIPGIAGGCLSLVVYTGVCLLLALVAADVFRLQWHAEEFLNVYFLGVPVEELMYSFAAGTVATVFYPFVMMKSFANLRSSDR